MCSLLGIMSEAPNFGLLFSVEAGVVELQQLVESHALTFKQKLQITRSVAAAVAHCHSHGRSVAWLNSQSVFVHPQTMQCQIVHACHLFYFSQRLDDQWERFRWQAPEVFFGQIKSSALADSFSLGLLLWYVLAETEPYSNFGPDIAEKLASGWR